MKKIIYHDKGGFESRFKGVELAKEGFQNLLTEVLRLDIVKIKSLTELVSIAKGGQSALKEILAEQIEPQKIGNLRLKPAAIVETLELPNLEIPCKVNNSFRCKVSSPFRPKVNTVFRGKVNT